MDDWSERVRAWGPPDGWKRILTVDAHAAGEPLRVIFAGFPEPGGASMLERRAAAAERHDGLRRALMWEPRGHADMYGCVVGPPVSREADVGVLFTHNEGYSTMCGHGIIGLVTVLLELGILPADGPEASVVVDTPAGLVRARATVSGGRVERVRFRNVPSFVQTLDGMVDVPGHGPVRYDLAFGGAFYAYVDAEAFGLSLVPRELSRIVDAGRAVKAAVAASDPPEHPDDPELGFLYGTIFVGAARGAGAHSQNVCVFADGEVDRSPTGTGVSGRLALHHARGEAALGQELEIESLIGTTFTGRIVEALPSGAVVPEVGGSAFVTGRNELFVDPADPLAEGFLLR